jgi:sulfate-transporting ATPase
MADDKKVIFSMSKLSKTYQGADKPVLKNIYLSFFYGAKIGILGLNGSGKSSLLKIIAGVDKNYQGDVVFAPGYTVGYLEQEPILDDSKTVIEIVREGVAETMAVLDEFNKINDSFGLPEVYENADKMEQLMDRQALLQDKIDALGAWEIDTKLEIAMDALRTPEGDTPIKNLSGGERRRVALCRLLLQQPDVLLLDEPTNHLDAESVLWLEQHLAQYSGTVIAVTHDRYFLDNVAGWILELDRGEGIPWKGNYSSWLEQKSGRMALEEKVASKRRKNLERELDWVRQGAKGRQTKQKARLQNYDKLLNEDQKQLDENLEIYIPNGPRLGTNVIEAKNVSKAFGDKLLYDNLNFTLPQAGIVGIIGPNGAGKSTIFKMIMGEEKPDSGEFLIGDTVKIAYVDQAHSNINPEKSIWENFADGQELIMMGGKQVNSRAYLSRFNFGGGEQNKKVSMLSGGERNRLHLAMTLKEEGNVLLLDEPTNDLDINTLRALEEGLENFAGCAVVISHDRWFLDRICTHILAFEGNSEVYYFEGGFSDYEENKKKRLGGDLTPKRLKYRKLIRS